MNKFSGYVQDSGWGKLMVDGQLYKKIIISNRSRDLIIDWGWKSGVSMHHNPGYRRVDMDRPGVSNVILSVGRH